MADFQEEKVVHDRLNGLEKRINLVDTKVDNLDDKLDFVDSKHSDRHLEQVKLTAELQATSKATEQNTSRMANSIDSLVDELKQSNSRTDDRFKKVDEDVGSIKTKLEEQSDKKKMRLEEKKLSNSLIISVIGGGFLLIQVCINVLAPIFFGG